MPSSAPPGAAPHSGALAAAPFATALLAAAYLAAVILAAALPSAPAGAQGPDGHALLAARDTSPPATGPVPRAAASPRPARPEAPKPLAGLGFPGQAPMTEEEIPLGLDLVTVSRSLEATEEDFRMVRESFGLTEARAVFVMTRTAAALLILDDPKSRQRVARAFGTQDAIPTESELLMVASYLRSDEE